MKVRRLGRLRITQGDHGAIGIDSTNVQQFTMNWESGLPRIIGVEGQIVDRGGGETFLRFTKGSENTWEVR